MREGDRFGSYVLDDRLAAGGMAEVFRARRMGAAGFARPVCVKRILAHLCNDREMVAMFVDEARVGAQLRHGNIVSIEDFGEVDGQFYLCMELVSGTDVATLLRKLAQAGKAMPESVAAFIAGELLKALDYTHRKLGSDGKPLGLVHRDVSPHNVLVSFAGEVKLTDFGIAKARNRMVHTASGTVKGKLAYMPPEQLRGETLDGRGDLFALGVVMFEMLAGRRPFVGGSEVEVAAALLQNDRPLLTSLRPDVSTDLAAVVERLLAPDVNARYATAADAQADLAAVPTGVAATRTLVGMLGYFLPGQASSATSAFSPDALPAAPSRSVASPGVALGTAPTSPATPGANATRENTITDVDVRTAPDSNVAVDANEAIDARDSGGSGGGNTDVDLHGPALAALDRTRVDGARADQGAVKTATMQAPLAVLTAARAGADTDTRDSSPTERTRTMVARGNSTAPPAIQPEESRGSDHEPAAPLALVTRAARRSTAPRNEGTGILWWAAVAGAVALVGIAALAVLLR